jgi:hypothetical protein
MMDTGGRKKPSTITMQQDHRQQHPLGQVQADHPRAADWLMCR